MTHPRKIIGLMGSYRMGGNVDTAMLAAAPTGRAEKCNVFRRMPCGG